MIFIRRKWEGSQKRLGEPLGGTASPTFSEGEREGSQGGSTIRESSSPLWGQESPVSQEGIPAFLSHPRDGMEVYRFWSTVAGVSGQVTSL